MATVDERRLGRVFEQVNDADPIRKDGALMDWSVVTLRASTW
jgi:hypothetical protein